ncbi:response regulator [Paenibacillus psychroresistens]|uniref:Response regulator n=1 Tax=Paenibacillus psychroresistens TaxID=1778678 RepID=A0A6B8RUX9_9BACL|nr:response regulator [Paenibacillus psychroresistens]QGQ99757.1 response regulator [Paenibacillus psychroresistens]
MFRVVIVEDEPPIIRSIKEKIISIDPDFKVVGEYHNGTAAMLEMDIVKPHVLITDLQMPVMDGAALLEQVREKYPEIICVILTGYQNYEYTRMAIRRGITDYLLKPPTVDSIAELLTALKDNLMQNQSLVEAEILQHMAFPNHHSLENFTKTEKMAREYFYHANYILLYAWIPPELQTSLPLTQLLDKAGEFPRQGERHYLISASAHECILLFGIHDIQEKRYLEIEADLRGLSDTEAVSFVLLPVEDGLARIPQLLTKARKAAFTHNYVEKMSFEVVKAAEPIHDSRRMDLSVNHLNHLISFQRKQKQHEFEKQLLSIIAICELEAAPRALWVETMQHLVRVLESNAQPSIASDKARSMEDEIKHAIWGTRESALIIDHLKRIFGRLFQENEEAEQADWLTEVEEYLEKYYVTNISLTDLSEKFNLNPSYLSYVFKSKNHKSPLDYLI